MCEEPGDGWGQHKVEVKIPHTRCHDKMFTWKLKDLAAFRVLYFSWGAQKAGALEAMEGSWGKNLECQQATQFVSKLLSQPPQTVAPWVRRTGQGTHYLGTGLHQPQEEGMPFF